MSEIIIPTSDDRNYEGCPTNNPDLNPLNLTRKVMPKEERETAMRKAEAEMRKSLGPELVEKLKDEGLALIADLITHGPAKVTTTLEELPLNPKMPVSKSNPVQVGLSMKMERDADHE